MATKKERDHRMRQVMDLLVTGYTQEEIANKLGVTRMTVVKDIDRGRHELMEQMQLDTEKTIAQMQAERNKRVKQMWTIALDPKSTKSERAKALQLLQEEEKMDIKKRQLVGIVPQDVPSVAIQNTNMVEGVTTIADSIRRKHPELLDKFKKVKEVDDKSHNK